jgi:uncharacterized membrane-anchored protein YjiN (DUF445 family)
LLDSRSGAIQEIAKPHILPARDPADPRVIGLRRMRLVATLLLVLMTAIFVATTALKLDWLWVPYLRAFAEAGMVGACADWFAIVALFRRPLGLPIPHTAIVARNKDRIGKALARFITNNFLTAGVLNERLSRLDAIGALAQWLRNPVNTKRLGGYVALFLPRIARSLPGPELGDAIGKLAQQTLATVAAGPLASRLLAVIWAEGEAQVLLSSAIEYAEKWLAANKNYLIRKLSEQSSRWVPKWIDKMIAEKVVNGLLSTLGEMRDPKHRWRIELRKTVEQLIADLASDPKVSARAESFKAELLSSPLVIGQAKTLWAEIERGLDEGFEQQSEAVAQACEQALQSISLWLDGDEVRKARLNRRLRTYTQRTLSLYRFDIGAYIERVVHDWDSTTLVDRLELQVGKDLQYIRINGTLVGGLVGLLIFVASKWIAVF